MLLRDVKVHYHVYKNPLLGPNLNQFNPIPTSTPFFSKIHLVLYSHLQLGLQCGLFP